MTKTHLITSFPKLVTASSENPHMEMCSNLFLPSQTPSCCLFKSDQLFYISYLKISILFDDDRGAPFTVESKNEIASDGF